MSRPELADCGHALPVMPDEPHADAERTTGDGIVQYDGETVVLKTSAMVVDQPYDVVYRGQPAVAVKRADGSVEFYGRSHD